jgi:serine/threonine protein phosphatase PrpC
MEDALSVCGCFGGDANRDLFLMFDGHNGADASSYANAHLQASLLRELNAGAGPEKSLHTAFVETHKKLIENNVRGGTTATAVLFDGQSGWVAHVGDSRVAVVCNGELRRLTVDHRPSNEAEAKAVRGRGGFIIAFGGREMRVNGMIAITRALGDRELVDALSPEPDVSPVPFDWSLSTLVVACDGLWDTLPDSEVLTIIKAVPDPQSAAIELRNSAYRHGSYDNISVMVIKAAATVALTTAIPPLPPPPPSSISTPAATTSAATQPPPAQPEAVLH